MCILLKKKFRPREVQYHRRSHSLVSTRTRIPGEAICHRRYEITPVCGGTLAGPGDNEIEPSGPRLGAGGKRGRLGGSYHMLLRARGQVRGAEVRSSLLPAVRCGPGPEAAATPAAVPKEHLASRRSC